MILTDAINRDSIHANGLVGWWPLGLYPDARDSSEFGRRGTLQSSPQQSVASHRRGVLFDGSTQRISISRGTVFASTSAPFCVSAWVHIYDFSPNIYPIICTLKTSSSHAWQLSLSSEMSYLGVVVGSATSWSRIKSNTPAASLTGVWRLVEVSYNGQGATTDSNFSGYVDGAPITFAAAGGFSGISNTTDIGAPSGGGASNKFDGLIDDVRVYNRARSPAEAMNAYTQTAVGGYGDLFQQFDVPMAPTTILPQITQAYMRSP